MPLSRFFALPRRPAGRAFACRLAVALLFAGFVGLCAAPARAEIGVARKPAAETVSGTLWISTAGSHYRDQTKIDPFIEDVRQAPFGELILQVRASGDAFYNSELVPKALGVPERLDPLATLLKAFHGGHQPRRVVAWLNLYQVGNANVAAPVAPNHVLTAHPDWLALRADGAKTDQDGNYYLEPGLPAVQQHLEGVVAELARNYKLDGLYLDPIADPGPDWGFHPAILAQWQQQSGKPGKPSPDDPAWIAFRAGLLTQALEGLARAAREARPELAIAVGERADGAAPATPEAFRQSATYTQYHQAWPEWLAKPNLLSRIYLKDFKTESSAGKEFDGWMKSALEWGQAHAVPVSIGVAGFMNESVDALAQLRRAADSGAQGLALADYNQLVRDSATRSLFLAAIGRTVLSPEYLSAIASAPGRKSGLKITALRPAETTSNTAETSSSSPAATPPQPAAASAATTASTQVAAVTAAPQPDTAPATPASEASPTSEAGESEAGSPDLPPPPPPPADSQPLGDIAGVPDEDATASTVEQADGRLLPARTEAHKPPRANSVEDEAGSSQAEAEREKTINALKQLAGLKPDDLSKAKADKKLPKQPKVANTQRELLNEMVNDPRFNESREWNLIRPDRQAMDYLKKTYGNIF